MKKYLFYLLVLFVIVFWGCESTKSDEFDSPKDLSLKKITEEKVKLTWTYSGSSNDQQYVIQRKMGEAQDFSEYAIVIEDEKEFLDDIDTDSEDIYSYKVAAFDPDNNTTGNFSESISYFSAKTKPTEINIVQVSQDTLKVTWKDNSNGEDGYFIDKKIEDGSWTTKYAFVDANYESFTDVVENEINYDEISYRVYAYVNESYSSSEIISYSPNFPAPSELSVEQVSSTQIRIEWIDNSYGEEGFRIERRVGELDWSPSNYLYAPANATEYLDEPDVDAATVSYRVVAYNDTMYSAYTKVVDINYNLETVGSIGISPMGENIIKYNQYTYIADGYNGVIISDTANPQNPVNVGGLTLSGRTMATEIHNGKLYVVNHNGGLTIYNLDNPVSPVEESFTSLANYSNLTPYDVVVKETVDEQVIVYIAGGGAGIVLIDATEEYPIPLSNIQTHGTAYELLLENDFLYLADGDGGLKKYNTSIATSLELIATEDIYARSIAKNIQYIFVASGDEGLKIVNKNSLDLISELNSPGFAQSITVFSTYAYIADKEEGIFIADFQNPLKPYQLAQVATEFNSKSIVLQGSYLYVANSQSLEIIQILP